MPSQPAAATRRRKLRVYAACDFCRRRKLGCDNAEPKCEHCRARGQDCTYAARAKKARPSNARISKLEEENARLRQSLRRTSSQPDVEETQVEDSTESTRQYDQGRDLRKHASSGGDPDVTINLDPGRSTPLPSSHVSVQAPHEIAFHGPSSVMFDAPRRQQQPSISSVTHAKNQLLADATRQRQLEVVNLTNQSLDFDGVPAELGMRLLSLFWNRQYYSGTVVYRPVFMRDMACEGPYFSKLLLNAIYFGASKNLTEPDDLKFSSSGEARGWVFRKKFESYLHASGSEALWKSEVTTVQALLIVADALFTWCDERTLSWHYMGIAVNMILDLGMHVDGSVGLRSKESCSPGDIEVNRRLFWSAYVIDKVQSMYQGRPARLRDMDNSIPILFLDEYDEFELFNTLTYSASPQQLARPTYAVSTFRELCQLSIIMDRILSSIYAEKSSSKDPADLFKTCQSIQKGLEDWRASLPAHLSIHLDSPLLTSVLPHTLSLWSMYNSLVILLHRPFVSDGHLQSAHSSDAVQAFSYCATAALEIDRILELYQQHFCMSTTPYFVSYATYVSATIHVRIAAQRQSDSGAHRCLQRCLDALAEHQISCHAPRQTLRILKGLMLRLGVKVEHLPENRSFDCSNVGQLTTPAPTDTTLTPLADDQGDLRTPARIRSDFREDEVASGFMDLDIDEIMRSFNVTSTDSLMPSNLDGHAFPQMSPPMINPELPEPGGGLDIDSMLSLDPLFGFHTFF